MTWPWQRAYKGCLGLGCLAIRGLFSQIWVFFFFFPEMRLFSQRSLFGLARMSWPWQHAHGGCLGHCCLALQVALALAACLSHVGLALGCCLNLDYVLLPRWLPYGGYHGL